MGITNIVIGAAALFGSLLQGNYYIEDTLTLKPGVNTISTPAPWQVVTLFSSDRTTDLPAVFVKNKNGNLVEWQKDVEVLVPNAPHTHDDNWVLRPKIFQNPRNEIEIYVEKSATITAHFFYTEKPFGRVTAAIQNTKISLGNFLFGEALLEGVDVKNFKNETELGGFDGDFKPKFITRTGWGADETLRRWTWGRGIGSWFRSSPPEAKYVQNSWKPVIVERTDEAGKKLIWPIEKNQVIKKIVLHHTGEYLDDRHQMRRDPKKHVRSIYYYHTITRGWGDIGYNFLIDKRGNIYEGRAGGPKTVGAHAENYNVGTIGISLIGNFNIEQPTQEQVKVLSIFLAYLTDKYNIPVQGRNSFLGLVTDNITSHRFVTRPGRGTSCAGNNLVKLLPALRNKVQEIQLLLKKLRSEGQLTGRDFLGLAPEAQKFLEDKKFVLPKKKPLIAPALIWEKPVIKSSVPKEIRLKVINNSKFVWTKGSALSIKSAPKGLVFKDFVIESNIVPNGTGFIVGAIGNKSVSNGSYLVELSPDFLSAHYFPAQYLNTKLIIPIKVVENFSGLIARLSANSFSKKVEKPTLKSTNSTTQLPAFIVQYRENLKQQKLNSNQEAKKSLEPKIPKAAFLAPKPLKKTVDTLVVPASVKLSTKVASTVQTESNVVETKIKLAGFNSFVANVSADKSFDLVFDGKVKTILAGKHIWIKRVNGKILVNIDGQRFMATSVRFKNTQKGVFTIHNYKNPRFGQGVISYNRFRGDLLFVLQNKKLIAINVLPVPEYLWGLAEEPKSEPEQKKHAIYVLARSYAVVYSKYRRKFGTNVYDLEDDPRTSQLYLGYDWEIRHPEQKLIMNKTRGRVITYQGKPVIGPYFTQSNGQTSAKWRSQYPWTKSQILAFDRGLPQKGHGVGLSGNTARQLAKRGKNYKQILDYFFDNIGLKKIY